MSPSPSPYFDYCPSADPTEQYAIGGLITTEMAYAFEPLDGIPAEHHGRILGTQCQLWTEYMPNLRRVGDMLFPPGRGHSEGAWSNPDGPFWAEFSAPLEGGLGRLEGLGGHSRPGGGAETRQAGG